MISYGRTANIVYIIGQLDVGGTERQLLTLIEHHDRSRFRPAVVCLSNPAPLARLLQELDCPTYILDRAKHGRIKTLIRVYQIIHSIQPDIVHAFGYASRAAIPVAKLAQVPSSIVSIRTNPRRLMTLLDRYIIGAADLVLSNTRFAISSLHSARVADSARCWVIHNGLDIQSFDHSLNCSLTDSVPENAGGCQNGNIICTVATLRPVKCLEVLLEAYAIVLSQIPKSQLWIVGDGPLREALEQQASDLGIKSNAVFWGMRSDVPSILKRATVGVLPSRVEGLSNAVIEYMAAKLPVVATNVGGNPELVIHGETGLLIPPNNSQVLGETLIRLLSNSGLAAYYGQAGRQRVEEYFSVERMIQETESVYHELLSQGGYSVE
jgi:glycosyltransferase involved in cell wall biosynthesis